MVLAWVFNKRILDMAADDDNSHDGDCNRDDLDRRHNDKGRRVQTGDGTAGKTTDEHDHDRLHATAGEQDRRPPTTHDSNETPDADERDSRTLQTTGANTDAAARTASARAATATTHENEGEASARTPRGTAAPPAFVAHTPAPAPGSHATLDSISPVLAERRGPTHSPATPERPPLPTPQPRGPTQTLSTPGHTPLRTPQRRGHPHRGQAPTLDQHGQAALHDSPPHTPTQDERQRTPRLAPMRTPQGCPRLALTPRTAEALTPDQQGRDDHHTRRPHTPPHDDEESTDQAPKVSATQTATTAGTAVGARRHEDAVRPATAPATGHECDARPAAPATGHEGYARPTDTTPPRAAESEVHDERPACMLATDFVLGRPQSGEVRSRAMDGGMYRSGCFRNTLPPKRLSCSDPSPSSRQM